MTKVGLLGIVPEELKEDNYEFWKVCLKTYLVGQGLWDVILKEDFKAKDKNTHEYREWEQKNSAAVRAILLACGRHVYSKHKKETLGSAKYTWDHLVEKRRRLPPPSEVDHQEEEHPDIGKKDYKAHESLYNAINDGNLEATKHIIAQQPNVVSAEISSHGDTALHVAILAGHKNIAYELIDKMQPADLEKVNEFGATPLSLAAISDNTKLAKAIVRKNAKLVTISNEHDDGQLPVIVAAEYDRKHMVKYLYSVTPKEEFNPDKGTNGATLLNCLIAAEFYDVASKLLKLFPHLAVVEDCDGNYALRTLANKPSAFLSGTTHVFWKILIYKCVTVHSPLDVDPHSQNWHQDEASDEEHCVDPHIRYFSVLSVLHGLGWTLLRCFVPDIKHIHDRKLVSDEAVKLLSCIFKEMPQMSNAQLEKMEIDKAIYDAIKHGIVEFIVEVLKYNPEFVWRKDKKGRTIFANAIILRQEKIFSLIYKLETKKNIVARRHDIYGNNFLHLAAKLSPRTQLERISGAALQMQRELQWFQEVETLVQPKYKEQVNENNRKPSELFADEHKNLAKHGEKWMKNTAESSMIIASLIAAVMFSTALIVPGGTDNIQGLPLMLQTDRSAFFVFMASNSLSMFTSSTSILIFFGILTSRFTENDFIESLPRKFIFGFSFLFFSIVTMMVSFGSALYLILHKNLAWASYPIIIFSTFPVIMFSILQFPVLIEMIYRTYGSALFDKSNNHKP